MKRSRIHDRELRRMVSFIGVFAVLSAATYVVPGLELVRPWVPGEPVPLVHIVLDDTVVTENERGELVVSRDSGQPGETAPPHVTEAGALGETVPLADAVDESEPLAEAEVVYTDAAPVQPDEEVVEVDEADDLEEDPPVADSEPELGVVADGSEPDPSVESDATPAAEAVPPDEDAVADAVVVESPASGGGRVEVAVPTEAPREVAAVPDDVARPGAGRLKDRSPAHGTPLEVPPGALDAWFRSMAMAANGAPGHVARALHWGDSTIAGDGITRTVRKRLQARFGDGGPGFLAVQVDPRWASRPGVLRTTKGPWKTRTITFGGAGNKYYGLGGTVSTAQGKATSTLGGSKVGDTRQLLHKFDIAYQNRPGGGTLVVQVEGGEGATFQTHADTVFDSFHTFTAPAGARKLVVQGQGDGPVTVYGVALETEGPGVTWETLGVAGAGQGSMFRQGPNHLARQVAWRDPDLVVYQMGGNELGYPSLKSGGGRVWKERYVKVVRRLRAGAPDASCLLITPLDQAERVRGAIKSKPTMATMVKLQRETARELGCGFWDAQAAMGGSGSFGVWMSKKLAWSDLYHLTNKGLALIGHTLADALEAAYDDWRTGGAVAEG